MAQRSLLEVLNPEDGEVVGTVPHARPADVAIALDAAERGQREARSLSTFDRSQILLRAAETVAADAEAFAKVIAAEGVKTIREARLEVGRCVDTLRLSAEEASRGLGDTIAFDQVAKGADRIGYTFRQPVGIVAALTPFNDPLNLVAHKIGPAIAAGNAVILKPHEKTPLSAVRLADAFMAAGLSKQILQCLVGSGEEVGTPLVSDPRVRMVSFTGGREVGKRVASLAATKRLTLELGSNCPTIVMADADLEKAVADSVSGAFWAAGQNCLHVQRILVQREIYRSFLDAFVACTRLVRLGPKDSEETDMGCMIDEAAASRVEQLVAASIAAGDRLLTGGRREGVRFAPTVFAANGCSGPLSHEEVFGPVTAIYSFETLDEAIRLANGVEFGLQAAVFTRDLGTAFEAIRRLEAGAVIVNDSTDYRIDAMPFGGIKGSGVGREGVRYTLEAMSEIKLACIRISA